MSSVRELHHEQRVAFAHEFRAARAGALRDAEAFEEHIFVMERLGSYIVNLPRGDLRKYQSALEGVAHESPLAFAAEKVFPEFHVGFLALYEEARIARNDAMHQGAIARHLARHAQELALIMEDALMSGAKTAREFMVRSPVCAELWQPLSAIRRTMLLNAFSFLPFKSREGEWKLMADSELVAFIRCKDRQTRLLMTLEEALGEGLRPAKANVSDMEEPIENIAATMGNTPRLIVDSEGRLLGLLTAFDLL